MKKEKIKGKNLEVKPVYLYFITSAVIEDNNIINLNFENLRRDVITSYYEINSIPNLTKFENDFKQFKKENVIIIGFSLLNVSNHIFLDGKQLISNDPSIKSKEDSTNEQVVK